MAHINKEVAFDFASNFSSLCYYTYKQKHSICEQKIEKLLANATSLLISAIVLAYGEACISVPQAQRISVLLLLVLLENAATTTRNNKGRYAGKSGRIILSAPSVLY
jgi:hypothetical protein